MANELYDVYFEGVAEGRDLAQAKQAFAQLFRMEVASVEHFFSSPRSVLKHGLDAATADKYILRLHIIGIIASKTRLDIAAEPTLELSLEPVAPVWTGIAGANSSISFFSPSHASEPDSKFAAIRKVDFKFSGRGAEYFSIWIVNILLSVITLGIYSAWAKVRNKQYFYGNTLLDNASFEYTAEPLKILKGRAIAVVLFLLYTAAGNVSPLLAVAVAVLMLLFLPWIIVNSLKFNARHSSYRNINFRFAGSIWGAAKAFMLWPLLGILSLGTLLPVAWKRQVAYIAHNHFYGREPFAFVVSVKEYYKVLMVLLAASIALMIVMALVLGSALTGMVGQDPTMVVKQGIAAAPALVAYIIFYLFVAAYFATSMANIQFNHTGLQKHHFVANWSTPSYMLLLFSNSVGILLTLGLFIPFARVRTAAYKAEHTAVMASGNLDDFIAAEREHADALGEGMHDIFDIDISV